MGVLGEEDLAVGDLIRCEEEEGYRMQAERWQEEGEKGRDEGGQGEAYHANP